MFRFKQFNVDQSNCAMKINTDGVLLGALAAHNDPCAILDIGTGTGVIALMLAQRFPNATIDAVEIDVTAAGTAAGNFKNSPFADRLTCYPLSFDDYCSEYVGKKYDLIVSNPPFYINSLNSPQAKKNVAKHADDTFFERMLQGVSQLLTPTGICWLILPVTTAGAIKSDILSYQFNITTQINISSYPDNDPHREILALTRYVTPLNCEAINIYASQGIYSPQYEILLKDFFLNF